MRKSRRSFTKLLGAGVASTAVLGRTKILRAADPWKDYGKVKQALPMSELKKLGG